MAELLFLPVLVAIVLLSVLLGITIVWYFSGPYRLTASTIHIDRRKGVR